MLLVVPIFMNTYIHQFIVVVMQVRCANHRADRPVDDPRRMVQTATNRF